MEQQGISLKAHDVRYVLTVPAIWSDAAKQFMRQAANEAGIENERLLIALEPEAASIYSQFVKSKDISDLRLTVSKVGTRYLVADLGGGTADIAVHEKLRNGFVKEIHRSRGDDCGGEFEAAKKTVDGLHDDDFSIRLPFHILNALFKKKTDEELIEAIQIGPHGSGITLKYDTLFIKQSMVLEKLFQPTKNRILSLLKKIASEVEGSESDSSTKINKILLVGGFSDSKYIQKAVREAFPDKLVITPESADLCVLKGAVIFGHSPELISHRVMRFTYGIRSNATFDCEKHDKERKIIVYKKEYCKDTFLMYVQIGSVVEIDTIITKTLSTMYPYQKEVSFPVCISTASNPIYADVPDCEEIGKLTVEITDPIKELRNFDVSLVFGNTEIQIHAKDSINRKDYKATLDFVLY